MKVFRSSNLWSGGDLVGLEDVEFMPSETETSVVLSKKIDLIEPSLELFSELTQKLKIIDWSSDIMGMVDALVLSENKYKPVQLASMAFSKILGQNKFFIDTTKSVVLIGDLLTVTSFFPNLIQLGFRSFIFLSPDPQVVYQQLEKLAKSYFGIKFVVYSMDDINKILDQASILIVDVDHALYPDTIESLTYFNFIITKALFLDVRSALDRLLVDEAERAELQVIQSKLFHTTRYQLAQNIISSK